jgi:acyl carrier protein
MSDVEKKLIEALISQFGGDVKMITATTRFQEDLNADSLEVVEMIMSVEEMFSIEVPDDAAEKLRTVGDLVAYIETRQRG